MLFSLVYFMFYFLLFLVLLTLWLFYFKGSKNTVPLPLPKVSILIAARNEEGNIIKCLQAIDELEYPKDKLEVLVGDDRSSDSTRALVMEYQKNKPYLTCVAIDHDLPGCKGKANVLAQLAHKASSDYFFITDADVEVPPTWVKRLLSEIQGNRGIVTGITTTNGTRWFDRMQRLDWLFSLGLMQVVADRGLAVSTMGNNMLVTREAYEAVGGFEGIPFSVTEDVQLFKEVTQKGYTSTHVFDKEALASTLPMPTLGALLQQRKRWMRGSLHLPWYMWGLFMVHSMYYPVWLPFFYHTSVSTAALVGLVKLVLQSVFVKKAVARVHGKVSWLDLVLLEAYLLVTSLLLIIYFFLPFKIKWKGRQY